MFAKPPQPPLVTTKAAQPWQAALAALSNPYIGVGGAAVFFGILAITLVLITGDPKAGTPVVRLSLAHVGDVSGPPGWKQALRRMSPATRRWTTRWSSSPPPPPP